MDVLPRFRFLLARCYEDAPALLIASGIGTFAIAAALVSVVIQHEEVSRNSEEFSRIGELRKRPVHAVSVSTAKLVLPQFSGAALVQGINNVAQEMAIPFDEASYVLDNSAAVPYKKYRVTLKTMAGYAETRKFIPALSAELPHLDLDSIHCTRPDLAASALSCELAFTAFYSKAGNE